MGVFIFSVKPVQQVSDKTSIKEIEELYDKLEQEGKEVHILWNYECDKDRNKAFQEGLWITESKDKGYPSISISYSSYQDFKASLVKVWDEEMDYNDILTQGSFGLDMSIPFIELLVFSDIAGVIDYNVAERLLKDFETYRDKAKEKLDDWDFGWYEEYIKIFKECVDTKGVILYK